MLNYLIVFIGAGIGGAARYWCSAAVYRFFPETFPFGTLTVNVIGSFIIGFVMFYLNTTEMISPQTRLLLTTGFCGGLTTFSTFAFETVNLLTDKEYLYAGINVIANVLLTLLMVFIALKLSRLINGA